MKGWLLLAAVLVGLALSRPSSVRSWPLIGLGRAPLRTRLDTPCDLFVVVAIVARSMASPGGAGAAPRASWKRRSPRASSSRATQGARRAHGRGAGDAEAHLRQAQLSLRPALVCHHRPPGAGKTTALVNSGLKFRWLAPTAARPSPASAARATATGGSRKRPRAYRHRRPLHDAGFRQRRRQEELQSFLSMLRRTAPKQPINGVILSPSPRRPDEALRPGAGRAFGRDPQALLSRFTSS